MTRPAGSFESLCEVAEQAAARIEKRPRDLQGRIDRLLERLARDPQYFLSRIKREPRNAILELTLGCNMRCRHCGSDAGRARPNELRLDEWLTVCDDLAALGARIVTLLGGEPLLSPHWQPVARHLADLGVRVNTITNGWTLDRPETADALAASALSSLGLSIDGRPEEHDALRGRPGSFARIERGIELLHERGFTELSCVTCVTRANLDQLPWLHEFLTSRSFKRWRIQICVPGARLPREDPLVLRPTDLPRLVAFVREYRNKSALRAGVADNVGYFGGCESFLRDREERHGFWTGCSAGLQTVGITSDGGVLGCLSFPPEPPWLAGSVRDRRFSEIWRDPDAFRIQRRFEREQLTGACADCRYGALCRGGCRSSNLGYTGELGDNPYCMERLGGFDDP
jgi:radical SAM protein with 4Fe4S-binding SPASM domain